MKTGREIKCTERNCVNIIHLECLDKNETVDTWKCKQCKEPTIKDVMQELSKIVVSNKDLGDSLEACHADVNINNALIKNLEGRIDECFSKLDELTAKCAALEQENSNLKEQINNQEQYTRLNTIEVFGIPELQDENVYSTVIRVATALKVEVTAKDIDCCHRLKKLPNSTEPRGIVIKFVTRWKKEEIFAARRTQRIFSLKDIAGLEGLDKYDPRKIVYINESLTKENRALLVKCREYKKNHDIKYLWIRSGKIFMRKADKSRAYVIKNVSDLRDVH